MFKKLKEKITEEVKSSPQRLQQLTQSVSDRLGAGATADDSSLFSLTEDDGPMEPGFTNVALAGRLRRNSNSSVASDGSFLPRYESGASAYQLQSDLEMSASEIEDNASTSSQLGHLSKEQIYSAFQKAQKQHHKYRGRYVDLARHYKELERDNTKMKAVLVETQDKAIRRVAELKEQCGLEQKAKAHLENALRVELDEKQYKIETLQTQIGLLQNGANGDKHSGRLVEIETNETRETCAENLELLRKDLNDARTEIENLNARLQESKANGIIFQSKEADYKSKILNLEKEIAQYSEREKENNLKLAQNKMELHNELLVKDKEITKMKTEIEALRQPKEGKLENLQMQNKKLIEKVENLTQKCNNYESELLKLEQYKVEIKNLKETNNEMNKQFQEYLKVNDDLEQKLKESLENAKRFSEEISETNRALTEENAKLQEQLKNSESEKENLCVVLEEKERYFEEQRRDLETKSVEKEKELENKLNEQRDSAKKALLSLETKIKERIAAEHFEKEEQIKSEFSQRIESLMSNEIHLKEIQIRLFEKEDLVKKLQEENYLLKEKLQSLKNKYKELEDDHLQLINEAGEQRSTIDSLKKELEEAKNATVGFKDEIVSSTVTIKKFQDDLENAKNEKFRLEEEKSRLETDLETVKANLGSDVEMRNEIDRLKNELLKYEEDIVKVNSDKSELLEKVENKNEQLERLKVELKAAESKIGDLQSEVQTETDKVNDLVKQLLVLKTQNAELEENLRDSKEKWNSFEQQYQELLNKGRALENDKIQLENRLEDYRKKMSTKDRDITNLKSQLQELSEKYREQEEKLLVQDNKLGELENKYLNILDENQNLKENALEIEYLQNQIAALESIKTKNEETTAENEQLTVKVAELESRTGDYQEELRKASEELVGLREYVKVLNEELSRQEKVADELQKVKQAEQKLLAEIERLKRENEELNVTASKVEVVEKQKMDFANELGSIQTQLKECLNEKVHLQNVVADLRRIESHSDSLFAENEGLRNTVDNLSAELAELKTRIGQLSSDNKTLTDENAKLLNDFSEAKVKLDLAQVEVNNYREVADKIAQEKQILLEETNILKSDYEKARGELIKQQRLAERRSSDTINREPDDASELKTKVESLTSENRDLRKEVESLERSCEERGREKTHFESQLRQLEHQYNEILHEKQLLQDEVQELKISPLNLNDNHGKKKPDNLNISKAENNLTANKYEDEINELHEKLIQYQSMDLTNRSSIEFYQNEVEKLKMKNEKLSRRLDETLVTLNHCTELSNSTEIEYLRNVLYNYMLGKESLVLARVIAAVCKFDDQQTELILQKEQQKQSLLGHLGIL